MAYGTYNGYLGFSKQSAKGTAITAPAWFAKYGPKDLGANYETKEQREAGGGRDVSYRWKSGAGFGGSFGFKARPEAIGRLLHAALGADSISGTGVPYTHTITPADTLPWYTVETGEYYSTPLLIERGQDCKVGRLKIDAEAGGVVECVAEIMGLKSDRITAAATGITLESDNPFKFYHGTFTLEAGGRTDITKFGIEIENVLRLIQTTELTGDDLIELDRNINLSLELKMANANDYNAIYYDTGTAFSEDLFESDLTIDLSFGTGASERELKLEIPAFHYKVATFPRGAEPEVMLLSADGSAIKGANPVITCTVKNDDAADYDT